MGIEDTANAGMPTKEKIINRAMSVVGGAIPASALLYIGMAINEADITHLEQIMNIRMIEVSEFMRDFRQKRILPDAEKYIAELQHANKEHERRLLKLESFAQKGDRCTFNDCQRLEREQREARESATICQTNVALLQHQINELKLVVDELDGR